jgi:hypothetical protein
MSTAPQQPQAAALAQAGGYTTTLAQARQVSLQLGPQNLAEAWALAEALAKSDLVPDHFRGKASNIIAAMFMAQDLGQGLFTVMRETDVIEGRLAMRAALKVALVLQSGVCEQWDVVETTRDKCVLRAKRRGRAAVERVLTWEEAKAAELHLTKDAKEKPAWKKVRGIMLRHRLEGWTADELFPDFIRGIRTQDELDGEPEQRPAPRVVNVPGDTAAVIPVGPPQSSSDLPPLPKAEPHDSGTGEVVDVPPTPSSAPPEASTGPFIPARDEVDRLLNQIHLVVDEEEYQRCRTDVERLTPKGHARRDEVARSMRAKRTQLDAEGKK